MTGFGVGVSTYKNLRITVEIKSVNHRFFDVRPRVPKEYFQFENDIKSEIQKHVSRGFFEFRLERKLMGDSPGKGGIAPTVSVNIALAKSYFNGVNKIRKALKIKNGIDLNSIARFYDVISIGEPEVNKSVEWSLIKKYIKEAMGNLKSQRSTEGKALQKDLTTRLREIVKMVKSIEKFSGDMVAQYRAKLKARIERLMGSAQLDEDRLEQEVVFFADRSDISEELTRLKHHTDEFSTHLKGENSSVGRKLEFILQEMNRETNTVGSKCNHEQISQLVIEIKAQLEKIREQVQNVE
jgi:uncharacterized protein (TIGR00255 family)